MTSRTVDIPNKMSWHWNPGPWSLKVIV